MFEIIIPNEVSLSKFQNATHCNENIFEEIVNLSSYTDEFLQNLIGEKGAIMEINDKRYFEMFIDDTKCFGIPKYLYEGSVEDIEKIIITFKNASGKRNSIDISYITKHHSPSEANPFDFCYYHPFG